MRRIDGIKQLCDRLAPLGWRRLLLSATKNTLDIQQSTSADLLQALTTNIAHINRTIPGFEDFATIGKKGVTSSQPALSLLYHALASPLVTRDQNGRALRGFATAEELNRLEDFIFSLTPVSLPQFINANGGIDNVAIVVFASEYRSASQSVDGHHADLCFSRTGISRTGTSRARYYPALRGFWPVDENNPNAMRVVPARFSAWLSVKTKGHAARVSPIIDNSQQQLEDEAKREFWIPVHKIFAGTDCLAGEDLVPIFNRELYNLKIQRIHKKLGTTPLPTGYPYVIRDGEIADLSIDPTLGPGWLIPTLRPALVERAFVDGKPLTFPVIAEMVDNFAAVELGSSAPAYIHARTLVKDGVFSDLNDELEVVSAMKAAPYDALHYVDFTGEGSVGVTLSINSPANQSIRRISAYALLSAPDFFPASGQFELSEWSRSTKIPADFQDKLWHIKPTPLSETRLPANVQLPDSPFSLDDDTVTAIVGMGKPTGIPAIWPKQSDVLRASALPDDAAGVFAPGWDVGQDNNGNGNHLAAYTLGSPFPEDAKLCAALSTFWPAVAPDVFRTFANNIGNTGGTVAPLTDEEIGQTGSGAWDGIPGPRKVIKDGKPFIEFASFLNADYVQQALENRFSTRIIANIDSNEYESRIIAVSRVYSVAGNLSDISKTRNKWLVFSWRFIPAGDPELQRAQEEAGTVLQGRIYRAQLCKFFDDENREKVNAKLHRFPMQDVRTYFVSPISLKVLEKRENDLRWAARNSER